MGASELMRNLSAEKGDGQEENVRTLSVYSHKRGLKMDMTGKGNVDNSE